MNDSELIIFLSRTRVQRLKKKTRSYKSIRKNKILNMGV